MSIDTTIAALVFVACCLLWSYSERIDPLLARALRRLANAIYPVPEKSPAPFRLLLRPELDGLAMVLRMTFTVGSADGEVVFLTLDGDQSARDLMAGDRLELNYSFNLEEIHRLLLLKELPTAAQVH